MRTIFKTTLLFLCVVICSYSVRDFRFKKDTLFVQKDIENGLGEKTSFLPFMVESSMMYSYADAVASGRGIPEYDTQLAGMSKTPVNRQFTNGLEYMLGYTYRLKNRIFANRQKESVDKEFEDNPAFASWCRTQIRIWAALVSGLIFLWLVALRMPMPVALFGGLLHAVSSSAIARYTGQDIVRGNFALPFIAATFLLAYYYLRKPGKIKLLLTGLSAFAALAFWDMTQICFAIWGLAEITRLISKPSQKSEKSAIFFSKRQKLWITLFTVTIIAAFAIPYHRTHMLIVSPLVIIIFPSVFILQYFGNRNIKQRFALLAITVTSFYLIWHGIAMMTSFAGNYGHFASLLKAKIRFFNIKPSNPDLLDFDARSIWVPAMHSANKYIYSKFFPLVFNITVLLLILSLSIKEIRSCFFKRLGLYNFPLFMFIFYGLGFFLIVRYHVFAIIFISILLPMLLYLWYKKSSKLDKKALWKTAIIAIIYFTVYNTYYQLIPGRVMLSPKIVFLSALMPIITLSGISVIVLIVMFMFKLIHKTKFTLERFARQFIIISALFILFFELGRSIESVRAYPSCFFAETAALIKWMRAENMEDETILTDFTLSPLMKAYCGTKIILQPKFEIGKTRENYRTFLDIMFHETEKELASFCEKNNAQYFIYDKGYPFTKDIYSPRYIAAAHELKPDSPANMMLMSQNRDRLRNFYEITPPLSLRFLNNRYIVFKVITESDKKRAAEWVKKAEQEIKNRKTKLAALLIRSAVFADPLSPDAYLLYRQIFKTPPKITLRGY